MGTSSSSNGPKDNNSLLPDWYEPTGEEGNKNWKNAKDLMTRYAKSNNNEFGRVVKAYSKAAGGTKNLAKSAVTSKKALIYLAGFISDIRNKGIKESLKERLIDFENRDIFAIMTDFVDSLEIDGSNKEDAVVRDALLTTIVEICKDNSIENFIINDDLMILAFRTFMKEYITKRILKDLRSRFDKLDDPNIVLKKENECKAYIEGFMKLVINKDYALKILQNEHGIIDSLYIDCYQALEGIL